ncbi:putative DNA repair protein [Desulfurispira natronophila]|uniref:Putative DNA repair protein n=1 Tax=Desulfurispira natronophila TaxID=682562 RepID=A0A7W7Y2Z6_9BACT|nr:putative DNA repair protein [Desulfurispira natronophila]
MSNLLKKSGWPGDRPLNSEEYQTLVKWNECLHSFSRLDPLVTVLDFATAVDLLHTTTRETTFQPESPGEAPIQIMGLLEAGGNHYDALWALGMHDENWPPTPRPNPLIPVVIQRLHNLPRSSAARELQYAQALTSRLLDSADDIIFSYPQRDGDRALRPSPLLQALVKTTPSEQEITIPLSVWENHQGSAPINELNDNYGPRLTSINLKGGASFFKDQSACPFRGYALHRLRADAPKTPTPGISPRIRGTLLHYALELIWKTLENSCRLHQTCDNDLTQLIDRSLQTATQKLLQYRNIEPCPLKLELQVLKLWLQEWMKLEASRPQFSVLCLEKTCELQVGELLVNLKIDRIDQSHQHKGNILIDYKSSDNSRPAQWIGPRPEEPQMLLYAAKLKSSVCGLAYGVINRDHSEFRGLARDDNILPNVGVDLKNFDFSSWEILIQQWSHELEQLAGEIQSGAATITPARGKLTCRYCPLSLLCRIDCNGELDTNLDHE